MASSATAFNTNNASLLLLLFIFFSLPSFDFKKFWPLARLSFLLNFNVNIQYFPFGKKRYIVEAIELSTRNLSRNQFHSTRKFFWVLSLLFLWYFMKISMIRRRASQNRLVIFTNRTILCFFPFFIFCHCPPTNPFSFQFFKIIHRNYKIH